MKQLIIIGLAIVFSIILFALFRLRPPPSPLPPSPAPAYSSAPSPTPSSSPESSAGVGIANPASVYCEEQGGTLELVSNRDGSQFGLCQLADYACEEWILYRGECNIEGDQEAIYTALIAKGLDLTGMKVVITKHLGTAIAGSVTPISGFGGGGYVFAVKKDGVISIVADGNGAIMCSSLTPYPDYPSYLISECINDSGTPVSR